MALGVCIFLCVVVVESADAFGYKITVNSKGMAYWIKYSKDGAQTTPAMLAATTSG